MSPAAAVDPKWPITLKEFGGQSRSMLEVLGQVWKLLPSMGTPLGKLAQTMDQRGVPPEDKTLRTRGLELLPLNPIAVDRFTNFEPAIQEALKLLLHVLNYLSMGGRDNPTADFAVPDTLSSGQVCMLEHLGERLTDLGEEATQCTKVAESSLMLGKARFDYAGEPLQVMEPLIADKVIPVWPKIGECVVQPVTDVLPAEMAEMLEDPANCLKPRWEWPESPHKSKVMATQEEWDKIVAAGHARGLMVPVAHDEVFRDTMGNMVLNGAGGVRKVKRIGGEERVMQRFISNLIPSNEYQAHLSGGDKFLPYLGQISLFQMDDSEMMLVDSEDFCSCFNLFSLPEPWRRYMCFEKTVDGAVFGLTPGVRVFPAMAAVPMGWLNAVSVIQSVVRTLVFEGASVPEDSEVAKIKRMPTTDDLTVIYLDSYDEVRRLDAQCAEALEGKASARHLRFKKVCEEKGLPLNDAKRLVGATRGCLQGGVLDGKKGWYKLAGEKQADLISLGMSMLTLFEWKEFEIRHFVGKATFGCCFRRPLLSIMEVIFDDLRVAMSAGACSPSGRGLDEVIMLMATTCLMGSSLRAKLDPEISCSDASPTGGGGAVATEFMPEPFTVQHEGQECWNCDRQFRHEQRYPCPANCRAAFCSLECMWKHRDPELRHESRACVRGKWHPPKFGERFAGPHAPLTHAVATMGCIEVQKPFDILTGDDIFTEEGRTKMESLTDDPWLYCEHWAPECRLFSKARGKPITLSDGRVITGPRPVRDARHVMGFSNLKGEMKARLRRSNSMALRALRRGEVTVKHRTPRHWTLEHPYGSWLWEFALVKKLEQAGFDHAVGSSCCHGGLREKWYSFFGSSEEIHRRLHLECPGHQGLLSYEVQERADGTLHYPTEEESEYPWSLCLAYARGLKAQVEKEKVWAMAYQEAREGWYQNQLAKSTKRLQSEDISRPMAKFLARWEKEMIRGEELTHLQDLFLSASMRGTDIRFHMTLGVEDSPQEIPYPALRWRWQTVTSYPWKQEAHINELELNALVVMSKHRGRSVEKSHTRWLHVLDSMVSRGAVAKGRSSSRRLNRALKKHAAAMLSQNGYCFPLWTVSQWNFSDKASRRHE